VKNKAQKSRRSTMYVFEAVRSATYVVVTHGNLEVREESLYADAYDTPL